MPPGSGFPSRGPEHEHAASTDPAGGPRRWARLHPLTPLARSWAAVATVTVVVGQDAVRTADVRQLAVILVLVATVGLLAGLVSWWFTRYEIDGDDLRVDTGVLLRRNRHIRLSRLQAVDVVQPLIGRLFGLAELRLEVAGGTDSEGRLAYLSEGAAERLRAELLARAAGIRPDAPSAPERVLVRVPVSAVLLSLLLSTWLVVFGAVVGALALLAVLTGEPGVVFPAIPAFIALVAVGWRELDGAFDFTVAESPDGLRLRHGLLSRRSQTVPPGRVQAVRIVQPYLWRGRNWVRVQINVAGYAGSAQADQQRTSVLLPVAPRATAHQVISRIVPGFWPEGVAMHPAPSRAGRVRPFWWRGLAWGADDRVFLASAGLFRRRLDVVAHGKTQSVRLTQGPWQRRLGLATVRLDTTPGPVRVEVAHREAGEGRALAEAQAARSRQARRTEAPQQWMTAGPSE